MKARAVRRQKNIRCNKFPHCNVIDRIEKTSVTHRRREVKVLVTMVLPQTMGPHHQIVPLQIVRGGEDPNLQAPIHVKKTLKGSSSCTQR
jgi:hypothetical protein